MSKCRQCGSEMKVGRENFNYAASGLDGVTLEDVEVRRCPKCGEFEVVIPRIEDLHRELAQSIARRPERLGPKEIRFMRKWLGLSGTDFAKKMGVDKATVSRWESTDEPQPMNNQAERLLRLMVMVEKPVDSYPLDEVATKDAKPVRMRMAADKKGWHTEAR